MRTNAEADAAFEVVGNSPLLARLLRDVREGRLNHAYILDGPKGSGRHTVAAWLCGAIACESRPGQIRRDADQMGLFDDLPAPEAPADPDAPLPCGCCPACQKVLDGTCPDIHFIGRDGKATLGVDSVRGLKADVLLPPNDLDTKIYVIEDAETMTVQAQNALLLTLEEPPAYVLFLLLCDGSEALLETIRSRAPVLRLMPVPDADVRQYLLTHGHSLPEAEMSAVLSRAAGSIGQAMALSDARSLKPILRVREQVNSLVDAVSRKSAADTLGCVGGWDSKRESVSEILSGLDRALRDLLLLKASDTVTLLWYTDRDAASALAGAFSQKQLLRLISALRDAEEAVEANGNVKLILTRMAIDAVS